MENKSDDQLMYLIGQGDRRALSALFDRHADAVLGYASRLMGSREGAEDISQEVWVKVVKSSERYEASGSFVAWLKTVTRNTSFNELKKNRRWQPKESMDVHVEKEDETLFRQSMEESLLTKCKLKKVKEEMDRLPEMQRLALATLIHEECTYDDVAKEMGLSVSAIKSLLFRARKHLVDKLGESYE